MIDTYTRSFLAVIAISLAVIAIENLPAIGNASAQSGPVRVVIAGVDSFAFSLVQPIAVHQQ